MAEAIIPQINQRFERDWLTRKEAATVLTRSGCPTTPAVLARLAANNNAGKGPPYTRIRNMQTIYNRDELLKWAETQKKRVE